MTTEDERSKIEIEIFKEFVKCEGLPIDPHSVEKRNPPEPDIVCQHSEEGCIAFEVAEICNEDIAREIKNPSGQAFWTSSRLREITKNKLSRSYETEYPVELLLYVDGREITPNNVIIPKLKLIIWSTKTSKIKFRRIWFLGRGQSHLIYDFG
jgi:hypothetical protein